MILLNQQRVGFVKTMEPNHDSSSLNANQNIKSMCQESRSPS